MDSMRHLSTSLPRASRRRQEQAPELIGDFKAAALSVTNLYKTAAASQEKARNAGYQDALDDVLAFLDKENMGLMDGEGWRVRQWATERLSEDGNVGQQRQSVSDEGAEEEQRDGSPEARQKAPALQMSNAPSELANETITRRTAVSEPPETILSSSPVPQPLYAPSTRDFTFQSSTPYPMNHDREAGMDLDNATTTTASTPTSTESVRIISRPVRGRHTNHNRRNNNTMPTLNLSLGAGAGNKRKTPYSDFFDISGVEGQDRRDGGGGGKGGKRGRHV